MKEFENFKVYNYEDKYIFLEINIGKNFFYKSLFNYFFDESKLLAYAKNLKNIEFNKTKSEMVLLYKSICKFIDEEIMIDVSYNSQEDIYEVVKNEYSVDLDVTGNIIGLRKDKLGKIGEYILSILLKEYFNFTSIIPKLNLITNNNMSIYGIDTLFYCEQDNLLLFGESKVSKNLDNGIALIKKSLSEYDENIKNEYQLVLSNESLKNTSNLPKFLQDCIDNCYTIEEFIKKANITQIGVPIFIMHGEDVDIEKIRAKLSALPNNNVLNINTKYYIISLPIIDKEELSKSFIKMLNNKGENYVRTQ